MPTTSERVRHVNISQVGRDLLLSGNRRSSGTGYAPPPPRQRLLVRQPVPLRARMNVRACSSTVVRRAAERRHSDAGGQTASCSAVGRRDARTSLAADCDRPGPAGPWTERRADYFPRRSLRTYDKARLPARRRLALPYLVMTSYPPLCHPARPLS